MRFYTLRKSIFINTSSFCKAVHTTTFMSYREPTGIDAERVIPELLNMTYTLSNCIVNYQRMHPHGILEDVRSVHLRGFCRAFNYGTFNTDFIVKKAYKNKDLYNHLLYCHNSIWTYINYLTESTLTANVECIGNDGKRV